MDRLHVVRFEVIRESGHDDAVAEEGGTDVKTTFAHFGLAMYHASVLEHGLVNALALASIVEAREQAYTLMKDPWEQRFKDTMMELIRRARRHSCGEPRLVEDLIDAADRRNRLAHSFWREQAENFCSDVGRAEMITELIRDQESFQRTDRRLHEVVTQPLLSKAGVQQDMLKAEFTRMQARAESRSS